MSEKYLFGQFTDEHLEKVKEGIRLYNDRQYWMCHEVLEDLWIEDMGDNARYVYWAIIQVATSFYHYEDGNIAGAEGMMKKSQDKFHECEKRRVETPLLEKCLSWKEFKARAMKINFPSKLEDYTSFYNEFKFIDPDKWSN